MIAIIFLKLIASWKNLQVLGTTYNRYETENGNYVNNKFGKLCLKISRYTSKKINCCSFVLLTPGNGRTNVGLKLLDFYNF